MKITLFRNSQDYKSYAAGETIFRYGDPADVMYVIVEGEVDIVGNTGVVIDSLSEGDLFGEMALVDDSPRSGTALAKTDCKVVPVNRQRFEFMVQNTPHFAVVVMTIMAERLRRLMAGTTAE
ncbi:MAG TPA: cyclic nucleotide-binding domain-containing protein [Anaerolineaceae bacterium]|nr:cyclic nucleotide-binding domain-containing protein [Anaerolineaceae bacterium]